MANQPDIWGPSGVAWLEANIGYDWPESLVLALEQKWEQSEEWILQCHPWKAFLLILRNYLTGDWAVAEGRLRRLIPVLARYGNANQMAASLSLLGLLRLDLQGWEPELEALHTQLKDEQTAGGDLGEILARFFFAQAAVINGRLSDADDFYKRMLHGEAVTDEAAKWVLGRVFEKMGLYLLRTGTHPMKMEWQLATDQWIKQFPSSLITDRLQRLDCHPVMAWRDSTAAQTLTGNLAGILIDRETEVAREILEAKNSLLPEKVALAKFLAKSYGDPFWIGQADRLTASEAPRPSIETGSGKMECRFTFFGTFQGYLSGGEELFPRRYGRKKVKQLLALLLLQPRYRMVKDVLTDRLFADEENIHSGNYLHVLMHRLRELFARATGVPDNWAMILDGMVALNENRIGGIDVEEYRKRASVGHQLWFDDPAAASELYDKSIGMYNPVVAPEFEYEDWIATLRVELANHQKRMLRRLWEYARENGQMERAVHYGELLLAADEWDLSVLRQLCKDWLLVGDRKRIADTCERYIHLLERESEEIPVWVLEQARSGQGR
ncbi:bacterial transcriptional activator domain-containing protein [Effusibacillus lacus]|uniref:Bacterial transcriptional activator domain-containing protein n=1 Tax=Effusibacillus lacus TaxID=1348429 RepID=A0A292YRN2_9BACL|nr:bacterial transcriptional activator domain-containing protein [Effusibacillus lacus]TCS76814.1 hypothetical protein EDD64_10134 [Effusibacillus lacus]GAX91145.1 hypothetical protein EFBL_2811 [Effusibacillus lacus]